MSEVRPNPPAPFPKREGGEKPDPAPPSLLGKGAGGLGSSRFLIAAIVIALTVIAFAIWYFAIHEPEPKSDLERFHGDWKISVVVGDQKRETDNAIRVAGDRWEYVTATTSKAYRVTLNDAANPKQIDLELLDTAGLRGAPVKMHGVYAFDGNKTARVVVVPASDPRPKALDDPDATVWLLTKVKLEEKTQTEK